jgi:hypothetical protein
VDLVFGIAPAKGSGRGIDMSDKVIVSGIDTINDPDPWDVGMVTERLPALELYDDGIEPDEPDVRHERAA